MNVKVNVKVKVMNVSGLFIPNSLSYDITGRN